MTRIKQVSMIRKYHYHTLHANPLHDAEEPQNTDCHNAPGRQFKVHFHDFEHFT